MGLTQAILGLVAAIVIGQAQVVSSVASNSGGTAGRWHVSTVITCVSNGYNLDACQKISGSAFAAFSLQGARLTIHASSDYTVDAHGRFSGHGSSVIAETAHGHAALRTCNPQQIAGGLWTGTCNTAWQGRGHIAAGTTGLPDFWLDSGTTTIHGGGPYPPYRFHFSVASDSRLPAVAGVYTTARYFDLLHLAPVRGVSIRTVVTHSKPR